MKAVSAWVLLIGITMFIWGFCQLGYAFMDLDMFITFPFNQWGDYFGQEDLFYKVQLVLGVGYMLAGFGVILFRAWGRMLAILMIWVSAAFFYWVFLLAGPLEFEEYFKQKFAVLGLLVLISLWFFNHPKAREAFSMDPGKRKRWLIPFGTFALIGAGYFVYIELPHELPFVFSGVEFPELQKVEYSPKSGANYNARYRPTQFPLPFVADIPMGTKLKSVNPDGGFGDTPECDFHLKTPGSRMSLVLSSLAPIQKEWESPEIQKFLERTYPLTPYAYARKFYSDRRSINFWKSRKEFGDWAGSEILEAKMDLMHKFIVKAESPGKMDNRPVAWFYEFHLYEGNRSAGGGKIYIFKGSQKHAKNLVASAKPRVGLPPSGAEYHGIGMDFIKRRNYEEAKMAFASAVCRDQQNPQYHYALGEAFFMAKNYKEAQRHLKFAVEQAEDFFEAKTLLEKTQKKLGKKSA